MLLCFTACFAAPFFLFFLLNWLTTPLRVPLGGALLVFKGLYSSAGRGVLCSSAPFFTIQLTCFFGPNSGVTFVWFDILIYFGSFLLFRLVG